MKNFKHTIYIFCLYLLTGSFANAQTSQPLSLNQAIKTGLENSKNLKLSKAKMDIAKAKYNQAVDAIIPSLKLNGSYTRHSYVPEFQLQLPSYDKPGTWFPVTLNPYIPNWYTAGASLNQTIFSGFRLKYAKESQELLQQAASFDAQKDSVDVAFNIIGAYFNIYKIEKSLKIITADLALVKQHLSEARNLEKQNLVSHDVVFKWETQQSNIEQASIDLENNLSIASFNFNLMLGQKEDTKIEIDTTAAFLSTNFKLIDEYIQQATTDRGDLLSMKTKVRSSQYSVKMAKSAYSPILNASANYYYLNPNQRYFPLENKFRPVWNVGISLSWDITNLYSNQHNISLANASLLMAKTQTEMLSDEIKIEINQNYASFLAAKKNLTLKQKSISDAEENYRVADSNYKKQPESQSNFIDATNSLMQAKINLIIAKADAEVAYYKLLKSVGTKH